MVCYNVFMGFSLGIVGLPNVGKSTLFSALCANKVDIQNYPFTTIDPNIGVVPVPDERLKFIHENLKSKKAVATTIEFYDIAGLVKGAHKGEGLGNQFLSQIRNVDAIAHVVRCFDSGQIMHVSGAVDPIKDIEIVETELILSDLELVDRKIRVLKIQAKTGDKKNSAKLTVCEKLYDHLSQGKLAIHFDFNLDEEELKAELALLTIKPVLYIANVDETGNVDRVANIKDFSTLKGFSVVPICSKLELDLAEMDEASAREYREVSGIKQSGLASLTISGYELLGLITFFTSNDKETHAWTIRKGTSVQRAAGKIHSDMEKKFIAAEVIHFDDLQNFPSLEALKNKGLFHLEGKGYIVQNGDLIYIRI